MQCLKPSQPPLSEDRTCHVKRKCNFNSFHGNVFTCQKQEPNSVVKKEEITEELPGKGEMRAHRAWKACKPCLKSVHTVPGKREKRAQRAWKAWNVCTPCLESVKCACIPCLESVKCVHTVPEKREMRAYRAWKAWDYSTTAAILLRRHAMISAAFLSNSLLVR